MSTEVAQTEERKHSKVDEMLDDHPEVVGYEWKAADMEVYVMVDDGKLAGRGFIGDMEGVGMNVKFVDFATNRIGFSFAGE